MIISFAKKEYRNGHFNPWGGKCLDFKALVYEVCDVEMASLIIETGSVRILKFICVYTIISVSRNSPKCTFSVITLLYLHWHECLFTMAKRYTCTLHVLGIEMIIYIYHKLHKQRFKMRTLYMPIPKKKSFTN